MKKFLNKKNSNIDSQSLIQERRKEGANVSALEEGWASSLIQVGWVIQHCLS